MMPAVHTQCLPTPSLRGHCLQLPAAESICPVTLWSPGCWGSFHKLPRLVITVLCSVGAYRRPELPLLPGQMVSPQLLAFSATGQPPITHPPQASFLACLTHHLPCQGFLGSLVLHLDPGLKSACKETQTKKNI